MPDYGVRSWGNAGGINCIVPTVSCAYIMRMNNLRTKDKIRRKSVNVSVREDVIAQAKKLGLNLSQITESALLDAVRASTFERWKMDNAKAIAAHNRRVDKEGALLDGLRTF